MRSIDIYTVILNTTEDEQVYSAISAILQNCGFVIADKKDGASLWVYGLPIELSLKLMYKDNAMRYSVSCTVGQAEDLPYEINLIKMQRYLSRLKERLPSEIDGIDSNVIKRESRRLLKELDS